MNSERVGSCLAGPECGNHASGSASISCLFARVSPQARKAENLLDTAGSPAGGRKGAHYD